MKSSVKVGVQNPTILFQPDSLGVVLEAITKLLENSLAKE